jgi:hypothetical protein
MTSPLASLPCNPSLLLTKMQTEANRRRNTKAFPTDFELYARHCLKIRTKAGGIEPLLLNRSQRYLHERLEAQRRDKGKVRALVLKGRQVGISTYIGGRFYWRLSHSKGCRAFILAHMDTASDNLFDMAKRFHENCPEGVRPATGKANAKELSFIDLQCGYKVATAGSAEVGRSETLQMFHGSEVAFWPNAQKHSAGITQAIADAPDTEDIRESTANGIGNAFHASWKAAERGDSDFEPIFIPWFWHEEYAKDVPSGWKAPAAFGAYADAYGITREQTYWAWEKNRGIVPVAGGTPDEPCWQFKQEYPANADEAFQTSGVGSFIPTELVLKARKTKTSSHGPIILGVDPARGGGDKTGIIDRQGRVIGAHICKRLDEKDLMATAGMIQHIVRDIKPAKVVIDTTGLGAGLYDRLRELLGDLVEGVNFGAKAYDTEHFANRRAEIWDGMRQWFNDPAGVQIPDQDELHGDLTAPNAPGTVPGGTRFNSSGQLLLEDKDHMRQRLTFSPDLGDAAALTFAVDLSTAQVVDWSAGTTGGNWMAA